MPKLRNVIRRIFKCVVLVFISLVVIGTMFLKPNTTWPPKIPITTLKINNPVKKEMISMKTLSLIMGLVYVSIIGLLVTTKTVNTKTIWSLLDFLIYTLIVYSLMGLVLQTLKLYFAIPRPNFLDVCNPDLQGYCDISTPTRKKKVVFVYTSFPSGHSATITYFGLAAIIISLGSPFEKAFKNSNGVFFYYLFASYVISTNLALIAFVCLSRIWDFYHRFSDVSVGILLGCIFAGITIPIKRRSFRKYYN